MAPYIIKNYIFLIITFYEYLVSCTQSIYLLAMRTKAHEIIIDVAA